MPGQRSNCCARCGEDLFQPANAGGSADQHCRACRMAPPAFVRAVNFGIYEGTMRGAIHALKYDRIAPLARELGRRLASAIAQMAPDSEDGVPGEMLVVPVPLHTGKRRERGFNQAETLATEALRALRSSHPAWRLALDLKALQRRKSTESQAGLTPRQRRLNLRGAFFVADSGAVRGRHILLVDDIYTTGATARACSKALMEAGAASIHVATLARAQRRFALPVRDSGTFVRLGSAEDAAGGGGASKTTTVH